MGVVMQRLLTVAMIVSSAVVHADPPKDKPMEATQAKDNPGWADAECKVRKKFKDATEISPKTRYHIEYAFAVTDPQGTRNVLVSGGNVYAGLQGLALVGRHLKSQAFLTKQQLGVDDLIFLVHEFGETPPEIEDTLATHPMSAGTFPGYEPKLSFARGGAALVVHAAAKSSGPIGAEPTPMVRLVRATLSIGKTYELKWKVEIIKVPATGL
jgi:hypothetical protein